MLDASPLSGLGTILDARWELFHTCQCWDRLQQQGPVFPDGAKKLPAAEPRVNLNARYTCGYVTVSREPHGMQSC